LFRELYSDIRRKGLFDTEGLFRETSLFDRVRGLK